MLNLFKFSLKNCRTLIGHRLAVLFEYFESQKFCAVEIKEIMRLVICGKDQLYKN